jgi:iron complex outermembrane receptor protein
VPNATVPGCASLANQINTLNGGNLDLEPETAKMYSLGAVFEPLPNLSFTADFFSIKRENTIGIPLLRQLVQYYPFFEDKFIRNANGTLVAIDNRWANAGSSDTQGIEFTARGGLDALAGRVSAGLDATYLTKRKVQVVAGGPVENRLGVFSFADDLGLRWKHNAFVGYSQGPLDLTFTQIYRGTYKNQVLPGIANGTVTRPDVVVNVDPYIIYNLSAAYRVTERLRMTFGVKNLFDTDPPFAITYDSSGGSGSSWEPRVADPRGRAFTLNVDVKFF